MECIRQANWGGIADTGWYPYGIGTAFGLVWDAAASGRWTPQAGIVALTGQDSSDRRHDSFLSTVSEGR